MPEWKQSFSMSKSAFSRASLFIFLDRNQVNGALSSVQASTNQMKPVQQSRPQILLSYYIYCGLEWFYWRTVIRRRQKNNKLNLSINIRERRNKKRARLSKRPQASTMYFLALFYRIYSPKHCYFCPQILPNEFVG